jgi:hypothetical protein
MNIHPFDLQARAEIAARALTSLLDAERDGLMYFLADWRARPPRADHGLWDCGDGSGRHVDALTLLRQMLPVTSPAKTPSQGERQLEGWMLCLLGAEGYWKGETLMQIDPAGEYLPLYQRGEELAAVQPTQAG